LDDWLRNNWSNRLVNWLLVNWLLVNLLNSWCVSRGSVGWSVGGGQGDGGGGEVSSGVGQGKRSHFYNLKILGLGLK